MKRIIITTLAALLLSTSFAQESEENNIRKEGVELYSQKGTDLNLNIGLNISEAMNGCERTKGGIENASIGSTLELKYECQEDNNQFKNLLAQLIKPIGYVVSIILSIIFFINAWLAYKEYLFAVATHNTRKRNAMRVFGAKILKTAMVFLIIPITITIFISSIMSSSALIKRISDTQRLSQGTNLIPELSSKNYRIEPILNYLICVKTTKQDSSQIAAIKIFETADQGLEIKANYGYCELEGALSLDTKGIEIAKEFGLFDYKAKQQEAAITALRNLIVRLDEAAGKIANGNQRTFIEQKLPEDLNEEQLYTIDVSSYRFTELNKYKLKINNYISRDFIYQLNKTPDITKEGIELQSTEYKNRRINICNEEALNPDHRFTIEEMKNQINQCVSRNCSDIIGSSSPYACSVSLEKLSSISNDKNKELLLLPASRITDKKTDYTSAKLLSGTINFQFFITDDVSYTVDMNKRLASINVSTDIGHLEKNQFVEFLEKGEDIKEEDASEKDATSEIISYFTTDEGFLSLNRFFTCLNNQNKTIEGYECKNWEYEFEKQSLVFTFTAFKLQTAAAIQTAGSMFKFKQKGNKVGAELAKESSKELLEVLKKIIVNKKTLALITPLIFDGAGKLLFEDIYGENYYTMVGDNGTFYAVLAFMVSSEDGAQAVNFIASTLHGLAQFLMYGHILLPISIFMYCVINYLLDILISTQTHQIKLAKEITMNSSSRRDLDKESFYIFFEALLVKPITIVLGYFLAFTFFVLILYFLTGDLRDFAGEIFSTDYRRNVVNLITVSALSLFLLTILFVISMSFIKSFTEIALNHMHGRGSKNDNRIQNAEEFKKASKQMKGKEL